MAAKKRKKTAKKASKKTRKTSKKTAAKKARKTSKKTGKRIVRHSPAWWAKYHAKHDPTMYAATGQAITSGPMTKAQHDAAMRAMAIMGPPKRKKTARKKAPKRRLPKYFKPKTRNVQYSPTRADYVGPILPKSHTRKAKKKAKKHETVTANQILGRAAKESKYGKLKMWICAGKTRTGCGGGRKGGHVMGILR